MAEKTKYVVFDNGMSEMTIARLEVLKDLNNVIFCNDMNIDGVCLEGCRTFKKIIKLSNLDSKQLKGIDNEDSIFLYNFNAKDIHELIVLLELNGYVAELEQEPTCIRDLIANVSVNDDAHHKLVSDMSRRILKLTEDNDRLRRNFLEIKDLLPNLTDAAKKMKQIV